MGHKVNPTGFRLGVVKGWQSRWYAERDYKDILAEDFLIRNVINKELANASVSRIEIERAATNQVLVKIHTARPGIVIGKSGEKVERLRSMLEGKTRKRVRMDIIEIRQPELDAHLVGRSIAEQLEKRVSFRRAMKQAVQKSMRANAKGIKIIVGGRLGGAEIARTEKEVEGKVPLQTLRADIDYGLSEAHTTFGVIGIKVWIYRGDILPSKRRESLDATAENVVQPSFAPRDGGDRRNDRRRQDGGDRGQRGGDRGDRGDRGQRPQGDRPRSGDRGPRPQGENRPPRPQGDRPQGDRPPRPQGERVERGPRPQGDRPQGDRPPRPPRPQGDRPPRPQGERVERGPRPEATPATQATPVDTTPATQAPAVDTTPATQATPPAAPTTDTAQSE
ncbi:MAG: 30S ribosomal protein S3 [Chloroflexota bacterium]|nr:30S ribosomal protein S3 [Chloroflexota bacterium]